MAPSSPSAPPTPIPPSSTSGSGRSLVRARGTRQDPCANGDACRHGTGWHPDMLSGMAAPVERHLVAGLPPRCHRRPHPPPARPPLPCWWSGAGPAAVGMMSCPCLLMTRGRPYVVCQAAAGSCVDGCGSSRVSLRTVACRVGMRRWARARTAWPKAVCPGCVCAGSRPRETGAERREAKADRNMARLSLLLPP